MVKIHFLGLHLPEVHADGSDWADELDQDGVFVSLFGTEDELGGVYGGHDTTEGADSWYEVDRSIVHLSNQKVARCGPDCKGNELVGDNSCVYKWVVFDSLRSSDRPSEQWVADHEVNEKGGEIPQPRELEVHHRQCLLGEFPVIWFNFVIWSGKILIGLTEIQSRDEENKDADYKWDQKS